MLLKLRRRFSTLCQLVALRSVVVTDILASLSQRLESLVGQPNRVVHFFRGKSSSFEMALDWTSLSAQATLFAPCVQDRDVTFVDNEAELTSLKEFAALVDATAGALRQSLSAVVCALLDSEGQAEWRTMSDAGEVAANLNALCKTLHRLMPLPVAGAPAMDETAARAVLVGLANGDTRPKTMASLYGRSSLEWPPQGLSLSTLGGAGDQHLP